MTGYESKRAAAQDKLAQESVVERAWFTIDELNAWADKKLVENPHWVMPAEEPERKEALAQPEQEPMAFAGIEMWVGNTKIKLCLTQMELHNAKEPWMLIEHMAEMCISKLKEKNT